jgi:phage gp46-like protein
MSDIRVVQTKADFGITLDWLISPYRQLDTADQLATGVIVALGTDARANDSDELPDPDDDDRRGWWGDLDALEIWDGWPIGSRLWILNRAKIADQVAKGGATVGKIETMIREALQPFITRKIASRIYVKVERNGANRIDALVRLYRGPKDAIELRFADLWSQIGT